MDSNTTSSQFEGEGRSARFLRLQEAILPPYASLLCHSESAYQPCLNRIPNRVFMKLKLFFFFFFQAPSTRTWYCNGQCNGRATSRYLTEPECNGSVEQRLKEGTPVRQNRPGIEPGPPETFPARTGHLSSRVC